MRGSAYPFGEGYGNSSLEPLKTTGRLTGEQCIKTSEESLLPSVHSMAVPAPDTIWLVQERSSIHTSRLVRVWLLAHPVVEVLGLPRVG